MVLGVRDGSKEVIALVTGLYKRLGLQRDIKAFFDVRSMNSEFHIPSSIIVLPKMVVSLRALKTCTDDATRSL